MEEPSPRRPTARPPSTPARKVTPVLPAERTSTATFPVPSSVKPRLPPATVTPRLLIAAASLMPRMPWLTVIAPVRLLLAPESFRVPGPDLVRAAALVRLLAMMTPPAAVLFWWKTYSPEGVVMPVKPLRVMACGVPEPVKRKAPLWTLKVPVPVRARPAVVEVLSTKREFNVLAPAVRAREALPE